MTITVIDCDSKNALLTINGKKVKLKVNRDWSIQTKQKILKRVASVAEYVISRKIQYTVYAEFNPDSMNNPVTLRSKSNKEIRIL